LLSASIKFDRSSRRMLMMSGPLWMVNRFIDSSVIFFVCTIKRFKLVLRVLLSYTHPLMQLTYRSASASLEIMELALQCLSVSPCFGAITTRTDLKAGTIGHSLWGNISPAGVLLMLFSIVEV
jgi:hypothetical protein